MSESFRIVTAHRGDAGDRVDLVLTRQLRDVRGATRTRVQAWIEDGQVRINGTTVSKPATRLALHDVVTVSVPAEADGFAGAAGCSIAAEQVPLSILYE